MKFWKLLSESPQQSNISLLIKPANVSKLSPHKLPGTDYLPITAPALWIGDKGTVGQILLKNWPGEQCFFRSMNTAQYSSNICSSLSSCGNLRNFPQPCWHVNGVCLSHRSSYATILLIFHEWSFPVTYQKQYLEGAALAQWLKQYFFLFFHNPLRD